MISIICVYNKENILKENLLESIKQQKFNDYEIILVDNSSNDYKTAALALNFGASKAKGEYLMFVHQDVRFLDEMVFSNLNKYLEDIGEFGVVGVAGTTSNGVVTNIIHGEKKEYAGNIQIKVPTECECLDEVLFVIKRDTYDKHKFDLKNDTWHLYCVGYCLEMMKQSLKNYVVPLDIYHLSNGVSFNDSYYKEIIRLTRKNKKNIKDIRTTCGKWSTNIIKLILQIIKRKLEVK